MGCGAIFVRRRPFHRYDAIVAGDRCQRDNLEGIPHDPRPYRRRDEAGHEVGRQTAPVGAPHGLAAIKNAEIEARTQGKEAPGDEALMGLLQKLIKQRKESAELYDKGGRGELAARERAEIAVIRSFLPQQMSEDEVRAAIAAAIKETGAAAPRTWARSWRR